MSGKARSFRDTIVVLFIKWFNDVLERLQTKKTCLSGQQPPCECRENGGPQPIFLIERTENPSINVCKLIGDPIRNSRIFLLWPLAMKHTAIQSASSNESYFMNEDKRTCVHIVPR